MDALTFFKGFGIMVVIVALIGGVGYWMFVAIKKSKPDFKYWFKYKVLRKKYDPEYVEVAEMFNERDLTDAEMLKELILTGEVNPSLAHEFVYIRKDLKVKELKGGLN